MSLTRTHYRVVGQDDYMLDITVEPTGAYRVDCGDHTSHKPRQGRLDGRQVGELTRLIDALGTPQEHAAPEGATGFMAELTLGVPPDVRVYRVWEGAMDKVPDVMALVRALEVI
ncbi:MAG: hypothetical protein LJE61_06915 [Thiocapsa sp.]|jgi:hypothetical protein|nr:hypothetical protein [Thiocapsa sp.]MCG6897543.1 hypothetical protein [Thiocapsa sp.]MCG6984913.1 hypothetical protein [Thiocapsa sp.]